ncbi:signal peptidase I [Nocardioides sp. CN2-186]|uniref:signal peptidase I n=1 Tax=Nocardioides tweenelious TaxID=3156607 RepID=UPI0032B41DAD
MPAKRRAETIFDGVRRACEVMLVTLAVGVALAAVVIPRLAGATPYAVLTGSMRPAMPPGTLVVVRPVDPADIKVGSVVTFQPRPDDPSVVTHRIVAQGFDAAGLPVYQTKGDANDAVDPAAIHAGQILGQRWYFVPYIGYLTDLLTGHQRMTGVLVVAGGLILYALVMLLGALRDRMRRPRPVSPSGAAHA